MNKFALNYIQAHIDYRFKNTDLLEQAFIRKSYTEENGGANNEVLEFIGDKVLDFAVVKFLSDKFGFFSHKEIVNDFCFFSQREEDDKSDDGPNYYMNEHNEGELTDFKAQLVQKKTLADRIDCLGFDQFLVMNKSDEMGEINKKASVKEDLFEAIIGAVALDSKWDLKTIEHVVEYMLEPEIELENEAEATFNYIGELQEWALSKEGELPLYHVEPYGEAWMYYGDYIWESRPFNALRPRYQCKVRVHSVERTFLGFGDSEKEARMHTAKLAMDYIEKNGLEFSIKDEINNPNYEESINQLEILARRGYFSIPKYSFKESHDEDGNPVWSCECDIKEVDEITYGESSSKKNAKKQAAFDMLQLVLGEE